MFELKLKKLPPAACKTFRVDNIPRNLIAVCTLVNKGCSVHTYYWGFEIVYNGELIYKGWREKSFSLFQMSLQDGGINLLSPETNPIKYGRSNGMVISVMSWSVNSIYECKNKHQLIKYYHANLEVTARAVYLQGCPGLTQDTINKLITV